jgi:hypothetical protein
MFSVSTSTGIYGLPLVASGVLASGFRIGLHKYIRPLAASVDAGPDDNRSQEPN